MRALLWLSLTMSTDLAYAELVAPFIMAGVGMGLVFAPSATALLATLGLIDHAKASGVNSTVREIGIALGTAVMTAIFVSAGGELLPDQYVDAARPRCARRSGRAVRRHDRRALAAGRPVVDGRRAETDDSPGCRGRPHPVPLSSSEV